MTDYSFHRVQVALFDPAYMNRQVTVGALQTLGFKHIETCAKPADFESALQTDRYELVIAELQGNEDSVRGIVRRVRDRALGRNPFVVIMLTTWDLNADAVRTVINCGADDLLARPFTILQLQQRIAGAITHRKPFVVTADYVGPSRRAPTRPPEEGELFDVPNPLRERALADAPIDDIEDAWLNVLRWKSVRLGRQIDASVMMLRKSAVPAGDEVTIGMLVNRIVMIAGDLRIYERQVPGPAHHAAVALCTELESAAPTALVDEASRSRFIDLAAQIGAQVKVAAAADRGGSQAGVVPYFIA